MKLNTQIILDKEKETDLIEQFQCLLIALNMISSTKINSEYVDNNDGTIELRLIDYEITENDIDNMHSRMMTLSKINFEDLV